MPPRRSPRLADDQRGLALGVVIFFAMLAIFALLYIMLDAPMDQIFSMTDAQSDAAQAQNEIGTFEQIWDLLGFFGVFAAVLFIIARAVLEQRPAR